MNEVTTGVVAIGWPQLALASGFIVATGAITLVLHLGVAKDLAIATLRTYVQLLALGFVLRWVFRTNTPLLVMSIVAFLFVIWRHRSNIGRLLRGEEPRIGKGGLALNKKADGEDE